MLDDHAGERPAHCRPRELRARLGCCAHVLTPRMSTPLTPVAAHAHMQDRGAPPGWLVRGAPDHRVTQGALDTRSVDTTDPHQRSGTPTPHGLTTCAGPSPPTHAIQAYERAMVTMTKGSMRHAEVFQMDGVGISIIERPQPLHNHDTPNATHNTYTPKCKEPVYEIEASL